MTDKALSESDPEPEGDLNDLLEVIEAPLFLETMDSAVDALDAQRKQIQDQIPVKEPIIFKAPSDDPPEIQLETLVQAASPAMSGFTGTPSKKADITTPKKASTKPEIAQPPPPVPKVSIDTYQDALERTAPRVDAPLSEPVSKSQVPTYEVSGRGAEPSLIGKVAIPPLKIKQKKAPSEGLSKESKKRVAKKEAPKEKALPDTVKKAPETAKANYEKRQKKLEEYLSEDLGEISVES